MSSWANQIEDGVEYQDKKCLDVLARFMKKWNPCLRPETSS